MELPEGVKNLLGIKPSPEKLTKPERQKVERVRSGISYVNGTANNEVAGNGKLTDAQSSYLERQIAKYASADDVDTLLKIMRRAANCGSLDHLNRLSTVLINSTVESRFIELETNRIWRDGYRNAALSAYRQGNPGTAAFLLESYYVHKHMVQALENSTPVPKKLK